MVRPSPTLGHVLLLVVLLGLAAPRAWADPNDGPHAQIDVSVEWIALVIEVPVEVMVSGTEEDPLAGLRRLVAMHPRDGSYEAERACRMFLRKAKLSAGSETLRWERTRCPQGSLVLDLARKRLASESGEGLGRLRMTAQASAPADPSTLAITLPPTAAGLPVVVDGVARGEASPGETLALAPAPGDS